MSRARATNRFARIAEGWVERAWPSWGAFVEKRQDGEFAVAFPAPKGSEAGHLHIFTWRGDLWVRYDPPSMCYAIDTQPELSSIVKQLLGDKALFVSTFRGRKWVGTTLVRRGTRPKVRPGEVAHVVSWSGKYDDTISAATARSPHRAG